MGELGTSRSLFGGNGRVALLWRGLFDVCLGRGGAYLVSGKEGITIQTIIEDLAQRARVARVRVIVLPAPGEHSLSENLLNGALADRVILALRGRGSTQRRDHNGEIARARSREQNRVNTAHLSLASRPREPITPEEIDPATAFCSAVRQEIRSDSHAVLLILEDLQNADDFSLHVISAVARDSRCMPLMIVATCPELDGRSYRGLAGFAAAAINVELAASEDRRFAEYREAPGGPGELDPQSVFESAGGDPVIALDASDGSVLSGHERSFGTAPTAALRSGRSDEEKRCDMLRAAGEAKSRLGDFQGAQDSFREAAEIADRLGDFDRLSRIVVALPCWHWPGPGQANPLALLLAQRGVAVERENSSRRAILMARLAAELSYFSSRREYSAELAAAAADLAVGNDSRTQLYVRLFRDPLLREPQRCAERLENAEEIVRLAVEVGDYAAYFFGGVAKSASLSLSGNMGRAYEVAQVTSEIVPMTSAVLHRGISISWEVSRAVTEGRFADAGEAFARCRELADKYQLRHLLDGCWPTMLMPLHEAGCLSEIEGLAEKSVRRRPGSLVFYALLAWLKMRLGKLHDASFLLDRLAADEFLNLSRSEGGWVGMAALTRVCIALNRNDYAAILYDRLLPYADFNAVLSGVAVFGSVETFLGILAQTLGRFDDAVRHLEKSFTYNRRTGVRPWAAFSRSALAHSLVARGGPGDYARAAELLPQIATEAEHLGMNRLLSTTQELRKRVSGLLAPHEENAHSAPARDRVAPPNDARRTAIAQSARTPLPSPDSAPQERLATFCRHGEFWELGFQGKTFSLRDCKGLELIHFLVQHAGREFGAIELIHDGRSVPRSVGDHGAQPVHHGAVPILDMRAKQAYHERIKELSQDLAEAQEANDLGRALKIKEEKDFLTRELARTVGLFGRDRKFGSEHERARVSVRMAISRTVSSILHRDEPFGRFLKRAIRTGNFCSYVSDPADPIRWRL